MPYAKYDNKDLVYKDREQEYCGNVSFQQICGGPRFLY
jgi:hypothetical protein